MVELQACYHIVDSTIYGHDFTQVHLHVIKHIAKETSPN